MTLCLHPKLEFPHHTTTGPELAVSLGVERGHTAVLDCSLWIDSADGDPRVASTPFRSLLDSLIEDNAIPGGTLRPEHRKDLLGQLDVLAADIARARRKVKKMPAWRPATSEAPTPGTPRSKRPRSR